MFFTFSIVTLVQFCRNCRQMTARTEFAGHASTTKYMTLQTSWRTIRVEASFASRLAGSWDAPSCRYSLSSAERNYRYHNAYIVVLRCVFCDEQRCDRFV